MKRQLSSLLFAFILALSLTLPAFAQETAPSNAPAGNDAAAAIRPLVPANDAASPFVRVQRYQNDFSDIGLGGWYDDSVIALYEFALTTGAGDGTVYDPTGEVKLSEALTFASRIRSLYDAGDAEAGALANPADGSWYMGYVAHLQSLGVIGSEFDGRYDRSATRAEMAGILAATLPETWFDARNSEVVTEGYALRRYITDVNDYTPYQPQILWLYKQGILSGVDAAGSYAPDAPLLRGEIAAMILRLLDPSARLTLTWDVSTYPSAVGTTYADLVPAAAIPKAPSAADLTAIDAAVRALLRSGSNSITLQYPALPTEAQLRTLTQNFVSTVKTYCEQMYNSVSCTANSLGQVQLTLSSTACTDAELAAYRAEALDAAIRVHDELWKSGALTDDMNEYEKARVYYLWLCENCVYDEFAESIGGKSLSHLAYNVFAAGRAVCDGYAGAYNLLLKLEGIECTTLFNADHIWTVATLDGIEYHIDPTWGDSGSRPDLRFFAMSEAFSRSQHPW